MKRNLKLKLDDLWRKAVKIKARNKCELCPMTFDLEAHHVVRRGIIILRWFLSNGVCLCPRHHRFAHSYRKIFEEWMVKIRSQSWLDKLMELKKIVKPTLDTGEIERELNEVIKSQRD